MSNPLFERAKSAPFEDWQKMPTVSEEDLLNSIGTQPTDAPPPPIQDAPADTPNYQQPIPPTQGNGVNVGAFFNEELATELMDTVLSGVAVWGASAMGRKVTRAQMSATAAEKEKVKPVMRAVLDTMNVRITNPYEALFYSIVAIYGTKVGLAYVVGEPIKKQAENSQDDKPVEIKRRHTGKPDCKCPKCNGNG